MEIPVGFEPTNNAVAARPLKPLEQGIICRKERESFYSQQEKHSPNSIRRLSNARNYPTAGRWIGAECCLYATLSNWSEM